MAFMVTIRKPGLGTQDVKAYCMKGGNFISSFDVDAATRKKSCGRALNKRLLEEDLTDLVQEE